ncbi:16S rRNA processing protein RimM [Actinomyces oris]|uniref:Ribosome maturation factor RimM n=1 Tax=Actinomyces oris TaxID=544580 RepID=A0A1Q8VV25_9ACTO|nr:16S rRNA processing protein RimM [Actinomyces oris]
MLLTLAVIGPAHALKGEVRLEIRTDDPEGRLTPGTTVPTEPAHAGPLTVSRLRFDGSRWFAAFEQARDRTAAEALRGVRLLVETDEDAPGSERAEDSEEAWYRHELVGLRALSASGEELGEVTDLEPGVAQDRLVVTTPEGDEVAVPFVEALVPDIDPETGTVTLAPPGGLFPGRGQAEEAR